MEKNIFEAEIIRNGDLKLKFRVCEEIENFFAKQGEKKKSDAWVATAGESLFFWKMNNVKNDIATANRNIYNDYGCDFFDCGKVNCAVLRTVGASEPNGKTLLLNNEYTEETLVEAMKQLKTFAKKIYNDFVKKVRIKSTLTIEEI